ncbi:MAG TPA: NADH:ubiquinone oxidoreductase subunit NDUFA12 [Amaricoccus sp.]|uniref:NADH:ubiquinone oxidoreductase subunit NDUFA12 n=1 Tax=Amaricoccus sp. TaxID=1872485 RepID=UPI002C126371|nr:NADH:ubiquinone oxidoreductase subunit NDUFA12 [Amaricoccus sp.]HMQ94883.1 NADH:ubiquinone oxidoreductase subunit NDUFA12 [Amaricoccus sp.]HMR51595.1 NADH:ubiquinone oxidoreductase subunit NDUFA12 [Amaricoccus sp.]HMR60691.1 NADH:ubiquinone oxidoreductase subunit NDUFA12 [Amaricoccus sp.]HMU01928.1 NADH:ubiquinone oxidoreductase subunit NDUFA12 [Amaricoccus sp.]
MGLLAQLFTWWNGETIATRFYTWRKGKRVGEDAQGNVFYQNADGSRRWVIYNGYSEASRVAPEWHGWLHHTWQEPPTARPLTRKPWEKPHQANLTGTDAAYRPPGSILGQPRPPAADYEAWSPE